MIGSRFRVARRGGDMNKDSFEVSPVVETTATQYEVSRLDILVDKCWLTECGGEYGVYGG